MPPVTLNPEQAELRDAIQAGVNQLREMFSTGVDDRAGQLIQELGKKAHALHLLLKSSGHEPRHNKHMIKNREVPPAHPEFYNHFHPLEDLLDFIHEDTANDDPEDVTIGDEFEFRVWSCRWGHYDKYVLTRTTKGWHVSNIMIAGDSNKRGEPYLFRNLNHDGIEYPHDIGNWLEHLWDSAQDDGLSHVSVQEALNALGEWVSEVEKRAPRQGVWASYK